MSVQGSPCDAAAERVAKENAEDDAEEGEDGGEAEGDGEEEEEGEDEDAEEEEEEEEGKQLRNALVLININSKDRCCPLMCFQSSIVYQFWYTSGKGS